MASNRIKRIAELDMLPMKPYQGWDDVQIDEALRRPELFRGNKELYASVRKEAIKRGLGTEEEFELPFQLENLEKTKLPFLLREETKEEKHKRKERKEKLRKMLMELKPSKKDATARLLRLAALVEGTKDEASFDRQMELYIKRSIERRAHFVPDDGNTPPMWRTNMDYAPEENSPYFGSVSEFLKKFPGGIAEWRKWRDRSRKARERQWRINEISKHDATDEMETFLKQAWEEEAKREEMVSLGHFVPEGKDDVPELGDKEPKIWSDDPKWKSIGEFLKAHQEHYGQDADDAALKAAKDFVKYWRLTLRKPKSK